MPNGTVGVVVKSVKCLHTTCEPSTYAVGKSCIVAGYVKNLEEQIIVLGNSILNIPLRTSLLKSKVSVLFRSHVMHKGENMVVWVF